MNFIIKSVLRKIFQFYLNIEDDKLDIESGVLKFASGSINHDRVNAQLAPLQLQILNTQYNNLCIHIPITQILSKPIKIQIQSLQLIMRKRTDLKEYQVHSIEDEMQENTNGYFKVLINRLLYNMEVKIESIKGKLIHQPYYDAVLLASEITIRNSLVLLQSNVIKKIVHFTNFSISHSNFIVNLSDLNISIDFNKVRTKIIAILNNFKFEIKDISFLKLLIFLQPKKRKKKTNTIDSNVQASIYLKQIRLQLKNIINLEGYYIQIMLNNTNRKWNFQFTLRQILLIGREQKILVKLSFLKSENSLRIQTEYEDTLVKNAQICLQNEKQDQMTIKVLHLQLQLNTLPIFSLMNNLIPELHPFLKHLQINKQLLKSRDNHLPSVNLLAYKIKIIINYKCQLYFSININKQNDGNVNSRVFQLTAKINEYTLLDIENLKAQFYNNNNELIAKITTFKSEISLNLFKIFNQQIKCIEREVTAIKDQLKEFIPDQKNKSEKMDFVCVVKCDSGRIEIGQNCSLYINQKVQNKFIGLIGIEVYKLLLCSRGANFNIKLSIEGWIISPHTLQKDSLLSSLSMELSILPHQIALLLKNNLNINLQYQHLQIIHNLIKQPSLLFCEVNNLTNHKLIIVQNDNYRCQIGPNCHVCIFWSDCKEFTVLFEDKCSQPIVLETIREDASQQALYWNKQNEYQMVVKFRMSSGLIRCMIFQHKNIGIAYRTQATFISNNHTFQLSQANDLLILQEQLDMSHVKGCNPLQQLLLQQQPQVMVSINAGTNSDLQLLSDSNKTTLHGIHDTYTNKVFDRYLYSESVGLMLHWIIMPFLIIKNDLSLAVSLNLLDRKTQCRQHVTILPHQTLDMLSNPQFDFHMKQFTFELTLHCQNQIYSSQSHYLNTFAMVEHHLESIIEIRSSVKSNYGRKHVLLREEILYKTKILEITNTLKVINNTPFALKLVLKPRYCIKGQESNYVNINSLGGQSTYHPIRLKEGDRICFYFQNQVDTGVEMECQSFNRGILLSFNFCKVAEQYYQTTLRLCIESVEGVQQLILQPFIVLYNMSSNPLLTSDLRKVSCGQNAPLLLPCPTTPKYNNRSILLTSAELQQVYNELFITPGPRINHMSTVIYIQDGALDFQKLLLNALLQHSLPTHRTVYFLLKDIKNRICFYLCDSIYNATLQYTIFNNESNAYFLLVNDDSEEYLYHFTGSSDNLKPHFNEKVFINKNSFNAMTGKDNYKVLLCDSKQTHLNQCNSEQLSKSEIRLQYYNIGNFNLIDVQKQGIYKQVRQVVSKKIQINVKIYDKMALNIKIEKLSVRFLEKNKIDILIQDVQIGNQKTGEKILKIPKESYFLLQGKPVNNFYLLSNLFIKCKDIVVNVNADLGYQFVNLYAQMTTQHVFTTKVDPFTKILSYLQQLQFLVKNIYIHEIHLSFAIQLDNFNFCNIILLPQLHLTNQFYRQPRLIQQILKFYQTNLLANFPKLSFFFENLKNPYTILKGCYNFYGALNQPLNNCNLLRFESQMHNQISLCRINYLNCGLLEIDQQVSYAVYENNKYYYLFTNFNLLIVRNIEKWNGQIIRIPLTNLQTMRITKLAQTIQLELIFKENMNIKLVNSHGVTACICNAINNIIL